MSRLTNIASIDQHTLRRHPDTPRKSAKAITRPTMVVMNLGLISLLAAVILSLLGIMAVATTQPDLASKQAFFLVVGLFAAVVVAVPHYDWARKFSYVMLGLVLLLLFFVMLPGVPEAIVRPRNGARRWINLGITEFQPSELAKIAFVLALANYLRVNKNYRTFIGLIVPFTLTFIPMGLILIEPDLGTSMLFLPTLFAMLIAAGAKLKHILLIVVLGLGAAPLTYPLLKPHQKDRIQALVGQFNNDTRHLDDIGYQGSRAMTLVGAGGVRGVGKELSGHLVYYNGLPEEHNDMIFAVVSNRWGLIGGVLTIGAFLMFMLGGLLTAAVSRDPFGRLVIVGFLAVVFSQMAINIGMTIGVFPITGMTLPFISYGGSSLVANWLMVGLIFNIGMRRRKSIEREPFDFPDEAHA